MSAIRKGSDPLGLRDQIDPATTALVLIDVQNDFCHPQGLFGRAGHDVGYAGAMVDRLASLLEHARRLGVLVVFVRATYDEEVLSRALAETFVRRGFPDSQCLEGSWGADWYGGLEPREHPGEIVVTKHRFSAFWGSPIDLVLRSNGIRTLIVTGVVTSGCVDSTLRDAFYLDYHVVVPEDCVGDPVASRQAAFVDKMSQAFGMVISSGDVVAAWADADPAGPRDWQPQAKQGRVLADFGARVYSAHTALVLVDLQHDFCHPDGAIGNRGEDMGFAQSILPSVARLLDGARRAGTMVIHVKAEYGPDTASDASLLAGDGVGARQCCVPGSPGAAFVEEARPIDGEPVVVKHRFSPFPDTRLELLLRANGIRTVITIGVATHCCVEATVRDACHKDFYVVLASDCCATRGRMRHLHAASLETMGLYYATIVESNDILHAWEARIRTERARA